MILQSLFVLACQAIHIGAQQPCLHAPQNPHSFAASTLSCAHYTICMGGNTIIGPEQHCPTGMYFDPPSQTCVETSCMDCSPFGIQNLPYPTNCNQFIECILGNRNVQTCHNGLLFDRTVGQCNKADQVYCPGQPTDPPTFPTDFPTEDPTDTTEWQPPTDPPTFPPTDPPGGERPVCRGQVFHAHGSDCTKFFICVSEVLWEHQCPNNLHWNQLRNVCDFPEHAGCIVHGGDGTTTESPWLPPDNPNLLPPKPNWT